VGGQGGAKVRSQTPGKKTEFGAEGRNRDNDHEPTRGLENILGKNQRVDKKRTRRGGVLKKKFAKLRPTRRSRQSEGGNISHHRGAKKKSQDSQCHDLEREIKRADHAK